MFKQVKPLLNFLLTFVPIVIGVLLSNTAYADCTGSASCDEHKFRLIVGEQFTLRSPVVHYKEKDTSSSREVNIHKSYADNRSLPFSYLKFEYQYDRISSWELIYNSDHTDTSALTQERIDFFFFPIVLNLRVPVKINTQSLKIFYNHALLQSGNFEFGGTLGVEVLNVCAEARVPIWGKETESATVPLPALGVFVSYRQSDRLTFRLRTTYFSLGSLSLGSVSVGGTRADVDFSVEYQITPIWMVGAGYRYSSLKVDLEEQNYSANGSYTTYGPTLYAGVSF